MVTVDYDGVIFCIWMEELHPNSHFTLNNSTFYMVKGELSDIMLNFDEKYR
jgi:hypothetical protein